MIDRKVKFFEDSLSDNPQGSRTRADYKVIHRNIIKIVSNLFDHHISKNWLDIGCSDGHLSKEFAKFTKVIYGIDIAESYKSIFERNKNMIFINGEVPQVLEELFRQNIKFDVVSSFDMLYYLEKKDLSKTVKCIDLLLENNGYFIVDCDNTLVHKLINKSGFKILYQYKIKIPKYKLNFFYFKIDRFFISYEMILKFLDQKDKDKLDFLLNDKFHRKLYGFINICPPLSKIILILSQPIKKISRKINESFSIFNILKIFGNEDIEITVFQKHS